MAMKTISLRWWQWPHCWCWSWGFPSPAMAASTCSTSSMSRWILMGIHIDGQWWRLMNSAAMHMFNFFHDLVNTFDFFFICCYELWFEWSLKWGCQKLGSPNAAEEVYYNSRRPHGTFYFLHSWRFSWCPGYMVLIGISYRSHILIGRKLDGKKAVMSPRVNSATDVKMLKVPWQLCRDGYDIAAHCKSHSL